eukprot:scaffold159693_cov23-Prasinocladus_malaysianus.AAC.3
MANCSKSSALTTTCVADSPVATTRRRIVSTTGGPSWSSMSSTGSRGGRPRPWSLPPPPDRLPLLAMLPGRCILVRCDLKTVNFNRSHTIALHVTPGEIIFLTFTISKYANIKAFTGNGERYDSSYR